MLWHLVTILLVSEPNSPCMYHTCLSFTHQVTFVYFYLLDSVTNDAMSVDAQISVQASAFSSLGYIRGSDTTELHGDSMFSF
jgi:hypothetical protein